MFLSMSKMFPRDRIKKKHRFFPYSDEHFRFRRVCSCLVCCNIDWSKTGGFQQCPSGSLRTMGSCSLMKLWERQKVHPYCWWLKSCTSWGNGSLSHYLITRLYTSNRWLFRISSINSTFNVSVLYATEFLRSVTVFGVAPLGECCRIGTKKNCSFILTNHRSWNQTKDDETPKWRVCWWNTVYNFVWNMWHERNTYLYLIYAYDSSFTGGIPVLKLLKTTNETSERSQVSQLRHCRDLDLQSLRGYYILEM